MNDYINAQSYRAVWTKIESNDPKPGMRGGHQMVIDSTAETLYLFGGWDGNTDLADLWAYDIRTEKWRFICKDTGEVVSNHKYLISTFLCQYCFQHYLISKLLILSN